MGKRVTQLNEATSWENDDLIPIVDVNDLTQSPQGSSLKIKVQNLLAGLVTLTGIQTLTNKRLTTPKVNEDVALSATATELNTLVGITATADELNLLSGMTSAILSGRLKSITVLTTGSGTYTPADGVSKILVDMLGGGGGGGGGQGTASNYCGMGSGGASGGFCRKFYDSLAENYAYSIGGGGGGGYTTADGDAGGDTTFGDLTANGGDGGDGGATGNTAGVGLRSAGGGASGGDLNIGGRCGEPWVRLTAGIGTAGSGGDSVLGNGGKGRTSADGSGQGLGGGIGSGGSGGGAFSGSAHRTGGGGGAGIIIIYEFY